MYQNKKTVFTLSLVTILIIGLVSLSSWKPQSSKKGITSDTTRKTERKREGSHSRKTIITIDENGRAHEEVIEDFEGDEGLRELLESDFDFDFPPIPDLPDFEIDIPGLPGDFMMPPMPDGFFHMDSLEFNQFGWNGDSEMLEQFKNFGPQFEAQMEKMREQLEGMEFHLDLPLEGLDEMFNEELSQLDEMNFDLDHDLQKLDEELSRMDEYSSSWKDQLKDFETAAQQELVKDGYLKESEKIDSMSWSSDEFKFNGKTIKEEHKAKYLELRKRYFKNNPNRGRPE
jgi:hypothetical protein